MYKKKECVAMLLAGGQGSRLYALTTKIAKPAVTFGGKYRIIDFPLSNCVNSGIDTVGVLTQYQPLALNEYIGNGQPWDLDRSFGGVHILSPYQAKNRSDWYKGTANAIYQNLYFLKTYDPEYVLILSGDHIYKMDYSKMLDFHKENGADCTIAAIRVPWEETSRFGIINTAEGGRITGFEEKPKQATSDLASMGIYIFNAKKLYGYLEADAEDKSSGNDFGNNVLPAMLAAGEKMFAYTFDGYWMDVGTINSLFEANMDLLGDNPTLDLSDPSWRIHSRNPIAPPHFAGEEAVIRNSIISLGCRIEGKVENSILSSGVTVEKGATVKDSIIMSGAVVEEGAVVSYSILDENARRGTGATVGVPMKKSAKIALVGRGYQVADNAVVGGGEILDAEK